MSRHIPIARLLAPLILVIALAVGLTAQSGAAPAYKHSGQKHHKHHHYENHKKHKHKTPKPPKSFYGVVPQRPVGPAALDKMKANGITVMRTVILWQSIQPDNANEFHFSGFDKIVSDAAERGISVLPYIYGTPGWVSHGLDHRDCASDCSRYAPRSAKALTALRNLTSAAAARYGRSGTLWQDNRGIPKKPIRTWQIWNEENSNYFYLPKPDPARYAKLLAAAEEGIHSQDSKATIVLGGIFGLANKDQTTDSAMPAATFVHHLLNRKGAKQDFDGVGLHPYSHSLKFVKKLATSMRSELRKSHDPGASMWITETGVESGGVANPINLGSKKAQAKRLTKTYDMFSRHRKDWKVKLVAWFSWEDVPGFQGACFFCERMGLVNGKGKAKPSLRAYKRVAK